MNEFLTWKTLGTYTGATMLVTLIVQYLKLPLDKVWKIPTKLLVYLISCFILILTQIITKSISFENFCLALLNGIVVSFASYGTYEVTFKKVDEKKG